jgi:hypothetical protein
MTPLLAGIIFSLPQFNKGESNMQDYDPFDDAMTPDDPNQPFYGQVHADPFKGFFETGGPVRYDQAIHGDRRHYLIISLTFTPIDPQRQIFSRNIIKFTRKDNTWQSSKEYMEVLLPSLRAMTEQIIAIKGLVEGQFNTLRELSGMYLYGQRIPNPDNSEGETWQTMKMVTLYPDEATCRAAWKQETDQVLVPLEELPFMPNDALPQSTATPDPVRETLKTFLAPLWAQAQREAEANGTEPSATMQNLLFTNPMLGEHFSIDSPEVKEVMAQ